MQLTEKELGLPWKVEFKEYGGYNSMSDSWDIKNERGSTVVFVDQGAYGQGVNQRPFRSEGAENRAAFIARAANTHHALLCALKDTLSYASRLADPEDQEWLFYRKQADAALLAVEGKVKP